MKNGPIVISNGTRSSKLGNSIKTDRFVWHMTYKDKLEDFSIAKDGLHCPEGGAVYAHNGLQRFDDMYPFIIDSFIIFFRKDWPMWEVQYSIYSYWRIDTLLAEVPWYYDPFMRRDAKMRGINQKTYICSPNPIPPEALQLYHFDLDHYLKPSVKVNWKEGVAHIGGNRGDFEGLIPEVMRSS